MNADEWEGFVDKSAGPDACWPWLGQITPDGYAVAWFRDLHRQVAVHRHALETRLGRPIEPGLWGLHTCHNRRCVNPDHVYEGTPADNGRDKAVAGRSRNSYTKFTLGKVRVDGGAA